MSAQPASNININAITAENLSDDALIPLFTLSQGVFSSPGDDQRPSHRLEAWRGSLQQQGAILLYATSSDSPRKPLGLLFIQPRTAPEIGHSLPHIWIAAVDPESRGQGIFALLMQRAVKHVRELEEKEMTVCTYPARFKKMYRILQQTGWKEVAWRENGDQVLMKLDI
ncbi:hypothetical protein HII31_12414 [Pseudocercospora fuligena]|uniref:N-acetyltransferase domain-containing protein n=1 Tax=Pseudocercospora fuligena TaxID=685502 RepID=A0A8H6R747_9PEZI|nr:hypothetical protein HII31_12414 [Pseudocercospora fuligena]